MIELRKWQTEAIEKAMNCYKVIDKHFAVNAAPGAGKTLMATVLADQMLKEKMIDRVIVIAPRAEIVRQWAKDFKKITNRSMTKVTKSMELDAEDIAHDIAATWSGISGIADMVQAICQSDKTLVIADEVHHAALEAAWGVGANDSLFNAKYVLVLTGTPVRSDGKESVWLDKAVEARNHYEVSYKTAVDEGWCVPATFHRHSGKFNIRLDGHVVEVTPGDIVFPDGISDAIRENAQKKLTFDKTARQPIVGLNSKPRLDSYHSTMLDWANTKLDDLRKNHKADAGAIVIAPTILMANYFAELITLKWPTERAMVIHSDTGGVQEKIEGFRNSDKKWIVSVNMISEGVDIHRLRVMVYLPMAGTELYFRQAVGRVIRKKGGEDSSRAYIIMPEQENFVEYASRIEEEMGTADGPDVRECPKCSVEITHKLTESNPCPGCGYYPPEGGGKSWTCNPSSDKGCSAINVGGSSCHACGMPKFLPYDLTFEDAIGYRNGAIARHYHISEEDLEHSEEIAGDVRRISLASGDPQLLMLLSKIPPELYSKLDGVFAEIRANRHH